jgi:HprK-related kinase B
MLLEGETPIPATAGLVLHLTLRDVPVTVRTDSPQLHDILSSYFAQFIAPASDDEGRLVCALQGQPDIDASRLRDLPRRGGKPPKESYYDTERGRVIVKKQTGMVIYSDGPTRIIVGDVLSHSNQVINAVEQVYMEEHIDRDFFLLHAAAVARSPQSGILIASPSGGGKSSAALAAVGAGLKFMSNDRVLVTVTQDGARLVGVPKKPRINPGTALALPQLRSLLAPEERDRYERMDPNELWDIESKLDVDVERVYGPGTLLLEAEMRLVFLLAWSPRSSDPVFTELGVDDAVVQMAQHLVSEGPYRPDVRPVPGEQTIRAILRRTRCLKVTGGVNLPAFASFVVQACDEF